MTTTEREHGRLREVVGVIERVRDFPSGTTPESEDSRTWLRYRTALKSLQGNGSNDMCFLACLLAKDYLEQHHGPLGLDVAANAQGAVGVARKTLTIRSAA